MSHRIKPVIDIQSREHFERVIDQIVLMQLAKERLELRRDADILKIREKLDPDINDLAEKMEASVHRAEKYAIVYRDELLPTRAKSAETKFASFGFRLGNPTLVLLNRKWSWAKVIEAVKAIGWPKFIVVKESIDKEAMKTNCTPQQLTVVGTRIEQNETFFIEPKRDPADPQRLVGSDTIAA